MRGAVVVVAMLAGCGFDLRLGDNTPGDARIDQALEPDMAIDAPKFTCPPTFTTYGTSQYRIQDNPASFRTHHMNCLAAGTGFTGSTHLAIIDSLQEANELVAVGKLVPGVNNNSRFYVGLVQQPEALLPEQGWIDFADRDVPSDLWSSNGEPDDEDENEINHIEQVAGIVLDRVGLTDLKATDLVRAVCECDEVMVGPKAQSYLLPLQ